MYWNMGGSILYLFALAYAALSGLTLRANTLSREAIFSVKTVCSASAVLLTAHSQCYFLCLELRVGIFIAMSPVAGERQDCENRVHTGRRSGPNTARQSPVSGTRYASALLSQQSKVPSRQTILLKSICHGRYVNYGFTVVEVI
jgi:hypothetical protein